MWILLYITPVILGGYYLGGRYIKQALIHELNEQLQVRVDVHSIEFSGLQSFPHLGIRFNSVRIGESTEIYKQSLLSATRITVEFNPLNLLRGQNDIDRIEFENGTARIYLDDQGGSNFQILKPSTDESDDSELNLNLKKVVLKNFTCMYLGNDKGRSLNFYTNKVVFSGKFSKERFEMHTEGDALFDHLIIDHQNYVSGKYCNFDVALEVNQEINAYHINKADLTLDELELRVSGDILMTGEVPDLDLQLEGRNMDIQSLLSLLPNEQRFALKDLQSTGHISLNGMVKGRLDDQKLPSIDVSFLLKDVGLFIPDREFDVRHLALTGVVNNVNTNNQLAMSIDLAELRMPHTKIKGSFVVPNVDKPTLMCQSQGYVDLHDIEGLIKSNNPEVEKLFGLIHFNLNGEMLLSSDMASVDFGSTTISGDIDAQDIVFSHRQFDKIEHLYFKSKIQGNQLLNTEIKGTLLNNDLLFKGEIDHWQSYVFSNDRLGIRGDMASQNLDINRLISSVSGEQPTTDSDTDVNLDIGIDMDVQLSAALFSWDNLRTENLSGKLYWKNATIHAEEVRFNAWEGKTEGKALIKPTANGYVLTAKLNTKEIAIDKLLDDFENFGQTEFTSEIISGVMTTDIDMRILFDRSFNVIEDSVAAIAHLTIVDGVLRDYQPMESLSSFVQLDDLMNIRFEKLTNTLEIRNRMIYVPEMMIRNSALNVQLGGSHSFDNYMDYKIKIGVTSLLAGKSGWAKRKIEQQLEDAEGGGLSAYLLMQGTPDDLKIKYDVKSVKKVVGQEIKKEGKTFFRDVKKELNGESIEKTNTKKSRWDE